MTQFQKDFFRDGSLFLVELGASLAEASIQFQPHWDIDHLCYRTESLDSYESVCSELEGISRLLIESEVNGRVIATYKLSEPFVFRGRKIDVVEVPAPKPGKIVKPGFEHVEVVVDLPFSELEKMHSHSKLDRSGLQKSYNQELEVCLPRVNFKFHQVSLESVIRLEKSQAHEPIKQSKVLEKLASFEPLIAGTFALDLDDAMSDVDVILTLKDKEKLKAEIQKHFSGFEDFSFKEYEMDGQETLQANFVFQDTPFELFAQKTPSVQQKAYLHFLIEERLLKLGGERLHAEVKRWRDQGMKTEPAFANALDLSGDPYEALLKLQKQSDLELLKLPYFQI